MVDETQPKSSVVRPGDGPTERQDSRWFPLQAIIDSIFDAYYNWEIQTGAIEFSSQLGSFLDIDPGSMNTLADWVNRLHPDDRERTIARLEESAREGAPYSDEYRLRRRDGGYALVRDRGLTLKDELGRPTRMAGVMRDVTREREAERALRESAELYQSLFERALNPTFHLDQDGRYLDSNEAGLSFLETTREALMGENISARWGAEALQTFRRVVSLQDQGTSLDVEVRAGSSTKAAILALVPCHVQGKLTCFALATDITVRRALQRSLEESNIALRVILEQRNRAREELEATIMDNVQTMVLPMLTRVATRIADAPEAAFLDAAIHNLREIVRPLTPALNSLGGRMLTRREREIADLIRVGKSSAEIARAIYISPGTVAFHRKNLRRKLGLEAHGPRLASHLAGNLPLEQKGE